MRSLSKRLYDSIRQIDEESKRIHIITEIQNKKQIYQYKELKVYKIISDNYLLEFQIAENKLDKYILHMNYQVIKIVGSMPLPEPLKIIIHNYILESEFKREFGEIKYKHNLIKTLQTIDNNRDTHDESLEYLSD